MSKRTTLQLALLLIGLVFWGYGQRVADPSLRLVGIAMFALATMLRFFRRSGTRHEESEESQEEKAD